MSKHQMVFGISVIVLLCVNIIESCRTPDGQLGNCIELIDCPVHNERYMVNRYDSHIKKFACDPHSSKLCCPIDTEVTTASTKTTPRSTIPEPTDMSTIKYHKNFGLINSEMCGPDAEPRISMGKKADLFQYKWNVLLLFKSEDGDDKLEFLCGGSLIADQFVLSAAHCVTDSKKKLYKLDTVRVGEHDRSTELDCLKKGNSSRKPTCAPPVQDIKVKSYKLHEMYNGKLSVNDIMVIKLEHPVKYARSVKTICLPTNEDELISKTTHINELVITGWGKTEHETYSDVLLFAKVPYLPLDKCMERMKQSFIELQFYESHICAGGVDKKDSCNGDSGGPLVGGIGNEIPRNFQFGIVSVGIGCRGQGDLPGVYTNVAYYMTWILDQMNLSYDE